MAEFHRVPVGWICGVPFALTSPKIAAQLIAISAQIPRLQVLPDGRVATMPTRADTKLLENQLMVRVEMMDVECLDCEDDANVVDRESKAAGGLAEAIMNAIADGGVRVAKVRVDRD